MKQKEIDAALALLTEDHERSGTCEDTYVWFTAGGERRLGFLMYQSHGYRSTTLGVQDVDTGESYDVAPRLVQREGLRSEVNAMLNARGC